MSKQHGIRVSNTIQHNLMSHLSLDLLNICIFLKYSIFILIQEISQLEYTLLVLRKT